MTAPATWPASAADLLADHPASLAAAVVEAIGANA
jgi:hypothetical protein